MTTTAADTAAAEAPPALSRPAELLLARLLLSFAAKRPPKSTAVLKQLNDVLPQPLSSEAFEALHQQLAGAGLADPKALRLTDAGRARALAMLGLTALPPKATWKSLLDQHLFPLAAGVPADEKETRQKLKTAGYLTSYLIGRRYGVPAGSATTPKKVVDSLVCRELGFPQLSDPKDIRLAVVQRLTKSPHPLKAKDADKALASAAFGLKRSGPADLRRAILQRWLAGRDPYDGEQQQDGTTGPDAGDSTALPEPPPSPSAQIDLPAFAAAAAEAARESPTGWFGSNKVFISHAWRQFRRRPGAPPLDLPEFKERLTEANRAGLLRLSRADLVSAMDPADVRESETRYLNAELHFILIEPATGNTGNQGVP